MNTEMEYRLNSLVEEKAFIEKLCKCEDIHQISRLLSDNGVEMSTAEIEEAMNKGRLALIHEGYITEDDELTEKALESVPGGYNDTAMTIASLIILAGAAVGAFPIVLAGCAIFGVGAFINGGPLKKAKGKSSKR